MSSLIAFTLHNQVGSVPLVLTSGAGVLVVAVAAGATHSVLSTSTGLVYTFGASCSGQCGHGNTDPVPYPRRVEELVQVASPLRTALFSHSGRYLLHDPLSPVNQFTRACSEFSTHRTICAVDGSGCSRSLMLPWSKRVQFGRDVSRGSVHIRCPLNLQQCS